jgi:flagellar biogenesis protein FliO
MSGTGAAGASYGDLLVTSLVVLGAVCIAAFVVVRLVGRFLSTGRAHGAHVLEVVARLPLEPRRSLYVVEVAGKTLLVGTSEMGLSVLSELDGEQVRGRVLQRPSFGDLVRRAWQRHARPTDRPVDRPASRTVSRTVSRPAESSSAGPPPDNQSQSESYSRSHDHGMGISSAKPSAGEGR